MSDEKKEENKIAEISKDIKETPEQLKEELKEKVEKKEQEKPEIVDIDSKLLKNKYCLCKVQIKRGGEINLLTFSILTSTKIVECADSIDMSLSKADKPMIYRLSAFFLLNEVMSFLKKNHYKFVCQLHFSEGSWDYMIKPTLLKKALNFIKFKHVNKKTTN